MQEIYVKTIVLAMACCDDVDVSLKARGTVEIEGKITKWDANFTTTWKVEFKNDLEKETAVANGIMGILGHVMLPVQRTFTYERP